MQISFWAGFVRKARGAARLRVVVGGGQVPLATPRKSARRRSVIVLALSEKGTFSRSLKRTGFSCGRCRPSQTGGQPIPNLAFCRFVVQPTNEALGHIFRSAFA